MKKLTPQELEPESFEVMELDEDALRVVGGLPTYATDSNGNCGCRAGSIAKGTFDNGNCNC